MKKIEKIADMKMKSFSIFFNTSVPFHYARSIKGQDFKILVKRDMMAVIVEREDGASVYKYPLHHSTVNCEITFYSDGDVGFDVHGISFTGMLKKHPMIKVRLF